MLRVSVTFAAFASALAAQCTREDWNTLVSVIDTSVESPPPASAVGNFLNSATADDAVAYILDAYNTEIGESVANTPMDGSCFAECVDQRYQDFYTLYKTGVCSTAPNGTPCAKALAEAAVVSHFCELRNVQPLTSFAMGADIDAAIEAAYATASEDTTITDAAFKTALSTAIDDAVTDASMALAYSCYEAYYLIKFNAVGGATTDPQDTTFADCKAALTASEPATCPQAAIDGILASSTLQETFISELAQSELVTLPLILTALSTDLNITDLPTYGCFQCEETYLMSLFDKDGVAEDSCDADCIAILKADRQECMAASVEVTTTTTGDGETTTGSGVVSASLSVAAVMVVALASL